MRSAIECIRVSYMSHVGVLVRESVFLMLSPPMHTLRRLSSSPLLSFLLPNLMFLYQTAGKLQLSAV